MKSYPGGDVIRLSQFILFEFLIGCLDLSKEKILVVEVIRGDELYYPVIWGIIS